ncbi:amidohydrolase family protein [bacterium]|nr:amidohydrolase family protein [bacterium]
MIDIHMHIGRLYNEKSIKPEDQALTPEYLLDFMDEAGIEKAVLLPIENPEATSYYVTTDYVLDVCKKYPDKFIPFCNVDPRRSRLYEVIKEYKDRGCKGMGEVLAGLYVDDPLMQRMYEICGELGLPIIFDLCRITCFDDLRLPRFENMIKKFPETTFIGHGPRFWAEISADYKSPDISYPTGKVVSSGAVERRSCPCMPICMPIYLQEADILHLHAIRSLDISSWRNSRTNYSLEQISVMLIKTFLTSLILKKLARITKFLKPLIGK